MDAAARDSPARADPAARRDAVRCASAARRASAGRRRSTPAPRCPAGNAACTTDARLGNREFARGFAPAAGCSIRASSRACTSSMRRRSLEQPVGAEVPAARATLEFDLQRGQRVAQPPISASRRAASAGRVVREPVGQRTRANGLGGAERAPDCAMRSARRGSQVDLDARFVGRVTRGEEARTHLRVGRLDADAPLHRHRGVGRRRRPRRGRPASSSASASAELESMRLKSSLSRA